MGKNRRRSQRGIPKGNCNSGSVARDGRAVMRGQMSAALVAEACRKAVDAALGSSEPEATDGDSRG